MKINSMMKLAVLITLVIAGSQSIAQVANAPKAPGGPGAPPQMSDADKKDYAAFASKAQAINLKYKPQLDAIQGKYKADIAKVVSKYRPAMEETQKKAQALSPDDRKGPKGQALFKQMMDIQKQMKSEPVTKKFIGEIRPIVKKCNDEVLAIVPAKFKVQVKANIDAQMKQLSE